MWETPGSGRSPGEGNGNPLQYSCLEIHGWRSLVGYSPWGRKESDMTEQLHLHFLCMLVTVSLCSPLSTPPKGTSHDPLMISWSTSCQQFWHRGPIIWKTIFPRMRSGGWFHDDSNALCLLCNVFLLLLHHLHLRSSGIRSWRLGTPEIENVWGTHISVAGLRLDGVLALGAA